MKLIQNSTFKHSGRTWRVVGIWYLGHKRIKYDVVQVFKEPQAVKVYRMDAGYVESIVKNTG